MKDREVPEPFSLVWRVPAHGFACVRAGRQGRAGHGTFLVERQVAPPCKYKIYEPLGAYTGLFRTFAAVRSNQQGVLEFANKYGQLGGRHSEAVIIPARSRISKGGRPALLAKGEMLGAWAYEISAMRALLRLWDAAQQANTAVLESWIYWHDGEVIYDFRVGQYHSGGVLAARDHFPEILEGLAPGDVVQPAWHLLQHELNDRLAKHIATPALVWDKGRSELRVRLKPTSLISALWLQFACAVGQRHSYRACAACGTWFQVGPGGDVRADAKYCSNTCRQRKFRELHDKCQRKTGKA